MANHTRVQDRNPMGRYFSADQKFMLYAIAQGDGDGITRAEFREIAERLKIVKFARHDDRRFFDLIGTEALRGLVCAEGCDGDLPRGLMPGGALYGTNPIGRGVKFMYTTLGAEVAEARWEEIMESVLKVPKKVEPRVPVKDDAAVIAMRRPTGPNGKMETPYEMAQRKKLERQRRRQ